MLVTHVSNNKMVTLSSMFFLFPPFKSLSTYYVKASLTPQNDATNSIICGLKTPFLFIDFYQSYVAVTNSSQYQFTKYSTDTSYFINKWI